MRLRRRFRVDVPPERERIVTLLDSHIRDAAEATAHACVICHGVLKYNVDFTPPDWSQCPSCSDVLHQSCLEQWIANSTNPTHFSCPSCRATFECDAFENDPDIWSADAIMDKLKEEFDPSFDDDKGSKSCEEYDNESDESGSGDGSEENDSDDSGDDSGDDSDDDSESSLPSKRTRSQSRPPPQPEKRVLRPRA